MKSKISLILILMLIIGCGLYLTITNLLDSRVGKFEDEVTKTRTSLTVAQPIESNLLDVPSAPVENFLEIEISSEDILRADVNGNIGLTEPFNSEYITRIDVINSINRIAGGLITFDKISADYQSEFLTLRHVEMVEGVREKDSSLHTALKEYVNSIQPIELEKGDITKSNTQSSDSELLYQADLSIAETNRLLNGGN